MKRICIVSFILSFFIIGILCVSTSGQVSASGNYYTEGYYKYTMDSDSVTIISYYGSESKVVIPDHIAALPVTRIESSTFAGNKTVKNVTIPETVTSIDDDLFYGNEAAGTGENFEVAGDNLEEIGNGETGVTGNLQDRPGITTENNKLITVDDTGNLVEIDAESNVKVIYREHKYTIKENEDGEVIITDENDNKVSVEKDGKVKLGADVKEEAAGNESEANHNAAAEDSQGAVNAG